MFAARPQPRSSTRVFSGPQPQLAAAIFVSEVCKCLPGKKKRFLSNDKRKQKKFNKARQNETVRGKKKLLQSTRRKCQNENVRR